MEVGRVGSSLPLVEAAVVAFVRARRLMPSVVSSTPCGRPAGQDQHLGWQADMAAREGGQIGLLG